jgi:hypothetical protein
MLKKLVNQRLLPANQVARVNFEELIARRADKTVQESLRVHHRVIVSKVPGLEDQMEKVRIQANEYYDMLSTSQIPEDGVGEPP